MDAERERHVERRARAEEDGAEPPVDARAGAVADDGGGGVEPDGLGEVGVGVGHGEVGAGEGGDRGGAAEAAQDLAAGEQEGAVAVVLLALGVVGRGRGADGLDVAEAAGGVERERGHALPGALDDGGVGGGVEQALVDAVGEGVGEEGGAAGLGVGVVGGEEQVGAPEAVLALEREEGGGHGLQHGDELGAARIGGRELLQHAGAGGDDPAVAPAPEFGGVGAGAILGGLVAIPEAALGIEERVGALHVGIHLLQLGEVGGVVFDAREAGEGGRRHVEGVDPPPVVVGGGIGDELVEAGLDGGLADGLRVELVEIEVGLAAGLRVGVGASTRLGADRPMVGLGPGEGVGEVGGRAEGLPEAEVAAVVGAAIPDGGAEREGGLVKRVGAAHGLLDGDAAIKVGLGAGEGGEREAQAQAEHAARERGRARVHRTRVASRRKKTRDAGSVLGISIRAGPAAAGRSRV